MWNNKISSERMGKIWGGWPMDTRRPSHRYKLWRATTQGRDYSWGKEPEVPAVTGPGDRRNWSGQEPHCAVPVLNAPMASSGWRQPLPQAWPGFKESCLCLCRAPHCTASHPHLPSAAPLARLLSSPKEPFSFLALGFYEFWFFVLLQAFEFQPTAFH